MTGTTGNAGLRGVTRRAYDRISVRPRDEQEVVCHLSTKSETGLSILMSDNCADLRRQCVRTHLFTTGAMISPMNS